MTLRPLFVCNDLVYTDFNMETSAAPKIEERREEEYLSWVSPSRLFKKRNREYFTNIAAIVFFLSVIFVFAREYALIIAMLSLVFFVYVLSTVPPEEVKHRITSLGIESAGHFYRWEEIADFWFEEQWSQSLLILRPLLSSRVVVLLGSLKKDDVREFVERHVPFREEPDKNWVDNAAHWLTQKIPLEKPS